MVDSPIQKLLHFLFLRDGDGDSMADRAISPLARSVEPTDWLPLVRQLNRQPERWKTPSAERRLMAAIPQMLAKRDDCDPATCGELLQILDELYRETPPTSPLSGAWLMWIASLPSGESLECWSQLILQRPPVEPNSVPLAFSPLLSRNDLPARLIAEVLEGLMANPAILPVIIECANFRFRKKLDDQHCLADVAPRLGALLSSFVQQMQRIEEGNLPAGNTAGEISTHIQNSVAIVVSLCDAIGLCNFRNAEGALRNAAELKHRRIQTEAAAALARMGFSSGRETLVRLAAEPSVRLRVLAYADELNLLESIGEELQNEKARAESKLAVWLAEPGQMGMAPSKMELLDCRELFWPGYDDRQGCYLFRFEYGSRFQSHGIVGPCVYAFGSDTVWMTPLDLYAAFAGWQVEHPEIFVVDIEELTTTDPLFKGRVERSFTEAGFDGFQLALVGSIFGELIPIASGQRDLQAGLAVIVGESPHWYPARENQTVDPGLVWFVEVGRRLLGKFNPEAGF